jgi:hypothetical protein
LGLCLPLLILGQPEFILNLNTVPHKDDNGVSEVEFVTLALSKLPKDNPYTYVAIHGNKNQFGTATGKNSNWEAVATPDLAKWIAEKAPAEKPIILLSSANQTATKQLVLELAKKTNTPKRKLIAWDEDLLLYENGHILGYGVCREYGFDGTIRTVLKKDMIRIQGNLFEAGKSCINLSNTRNSLTDWVHDWEKTTIQEAKNTANNQ